MKAPDELMTIMGGKNPYFFLYITQMHKLVKLTY